MCETSKYTRAIELRNMVFCDLLLARDIGALDARYISRHGIALDVSTAVRKIVVEPGQSEDVVVCHDGWFVHLVGV